MKQTNTADVFALIRKSGRITRRQIADKTEMSWGAVSTITSRLIEEGYVMETKSDESAVGRTPFYLEVDGRHHFSLGIDVNISGLRAVVVNLRNEVTDVFEDRADMTDREALLSGICGLIERAMMLSGDKHIICIGVAMQGITDSQNGVSVSLSECRGWSDVPLAYILEKKFSIPVHIEHDPSCILYAISGDPREDTALVRVDRGIGMAVMLGGRIIDKPGIFELGHTVVRPGGEACSCGKRGCLQLYATIDGLERLSERSFDELVFDARLGSETALSYFEEMADCLSFAAVGFADLMRLERIVLCGDMCGYKDLFFERFTEKKAEYDPKDNISVSFADVEMAAKGASMLATRAALKRIRIE